MTRVTDFIKTSLKTALAPDNKCDKLNSVEQLVRRVPKAKSIFTVERRARDIAGVSGEYAGHWGRAAATPSHVFTGWDPPNPRGP